MSTTSCHCCRVYSKEAQLRQVATTVLPNLPAAEWSLFWDINFLPPTTGSSELCIFSVIRDVFLFLEFDLGTLLAVRATCRWWNVMASFVPHWRYILPPRASVAEIVSRQRWDLPPRFVRVPLVDREEEEEGEGDKEKHYRIVAAESLKKPNLLAIASHHATRGGKAVCKSVLDVDCSDCSSCSCSSSDDDNEVERMEDEKRKKFVEFHKSATSAAAGGVVASSPFTDNDVETQEQQQQALSPSPTSHSVAVLLSAIDRPHESVDAVARRTFDPKFNDGPKLRSGGRGATTAAEAAAPVIDWTARLAQTAVSVPPTAAAAPKNDGDDDAGDDDTSPLLIATHDSGAANSYGSTTMEDGQQQLSMQTVNNDNDNDNDDDDDDATSTTSTDSTITSIRSASDSNNKKGKSLSADELTEPPLHHHVPLRCFTRAEAKAVPAALLRRPFRVQSQIFTTARWRRQVLADAEIRKQLLYPTFEHFAYDVRCAIATLRGRGAITFCEMWGGSIVIMLIAVICTAACVVGNFFMGAHFLQQTFTGDDHTDAALIRTSTIFTSLFVAVLGPVLCIRSAKLIDKKGYRDPTLQKLITFVGWMMCLIPVLSVALALLEFRIASVDWLFFDSASSTTGRGCGTAVALGLCSTNNASAACPQINSSLPRHIAYSSFLFLPPGTRILHHPYNVPRVANLRDAKVVPPLDAAENNTRDIINRAHVSYYTLFFPSLQNSSSSDNITVIVIGEQWRAPFWSANCGFHNNSKLFSEFEQQVKDHTNKTATFKPYSALNAVFDNVLSPASGADAIGNASLVLPELADAIAALGADDSLTNSSAATPQCRTANSSMVVVRTRREKKKKQQQEVNEGNDDDDDDDDKVPSFFLRLANPSPHWSASWTTDSTVTSPFADISLDYKQHGIFALVADNAMLTAVTPSMSSKDPTPPHVSPFSWTDDASYFYSAADEKMNCSALQEQQQQEQLMKSTVAPFWSGAIPGGLAAIRHDYSTGVRGLIIFFFSTLFFATLFFFWGRGVFRTMFAVQSMMAIFVVAVWPLAPLIVIANCWTYSVVDSFHELSLPTTCLFVDKADMLGSFIFVNVVCGWPVFCMLTWWVLHIVRDECGVDWVQPVERAMAKWVQRPVSGLAEAIYDVKCCCDDW